MTDTLNKQAEEFGLEYDYAIKTVLKDGTWGKGGVLDRVDPLRAQQPGAKKRISDGCNASLERIEGTSEYAEGIWSGDDINDSPRTRVNVFSSRELAEWNAEVDFAKEVFKQQYQSPQQKRSFVEPRLRAVAKATNVASQLRHADDAELVQATIEDLMLACEPDVRNLQ